MVDTGPVWRLIIAGVVLVVGLSLLASVIFWVGGCAAPGARAGTLDHNTLEATVSPEITAELTAALARIDDIEAALVRVGAVEATGVGRDVNLGGGGDSVTAWIYAVISALAADAAEAAQPADGGG